LERQRFAEEKSSIDSMGACTTRKTLIDKNGLCGAFKNALTTKIFL
jgi:hypothetical protein